ASHALSTGGAPDRRLHSRPPAAPAVRVGRAECHEAATAATTETEETHARPPRRTRDHHRGVRHRHRGGCGPGGPAVQAAHRRLRRAAAPHPVRPRARVVGDRVTHDERGAATAELALAIPLLLSLTIGLVWLLSVGSA